MLYNSPCSRDTYHEKIGLHPRSCLILSSTCIMTDQIGLQSVLLSLQITANHVQSFCYSFGCNHIYDMMMMMMTMFIIIIVIIVTIVRIMLMIAT